MKRDILFKTVLLPCVMLTATVALATSETFADKTTEGLIKDDNSTGWVGNGTVATATGSQTLTVGLPITKGENGTATSPTDSNVLSFEGQVVRTHSATADATKSTIDFLLYAGEAGDDSTSFEDTETGVQIALTTGALAAEDAFTVNLMLYCIPRGGGSTASWVTVGSAAKGSWLRVTFAMDYNADRARVSVDGEPLVSTHGYADETETDVNTQGAWYKLATSGAKVGTLTFAGVAQIDEVVVAEATSEMPTVQYADKVVLNSAATETDAYKPTVSRTEMNEWGVTSSTAGTIKLDNSGHTVLDKLELGYEPTDDKKFVPTSMALSVEGEGDDAKQYASITFPKPTRTAPSYTLVVLDGETSHTITVSSEDLDLTGDEAKVKVDLSSKTWTSNVLKFKLKAVGGNVSEALQSTN